MNGKKTWHQKASSIAANIIPLLQRYRHDTVLMIFCLAGIITVPILAIFTKPLMLTKGLIIDNHYSNHL
jgi:hypothetical protein